MIPGLGKYQVAAVELSVPDLTISICWSLTRESSCGIEENSMSEVYQMSNLC